MVKCVLYNKNNNVGCCLAATGSRDYVNCVVFDDNESTAASFRHCFPSLKSFISRCLVDENKMILPSSYFLHTSNAPNDKSITLQEIMCANIKDMSRLHVIWRSKCSLEFPLMRLLLKPEQRKNYELRNSILLSSPFSEKTHYSEQVMRNRRSEQNLGEITCEKKKKKETRRRKEHENILKVHWMWSTQIIHNMSDALSLMSSSRPLHPSGAFTCVLTLKHRQNTYTVASHAYASPHLTAHTTKKKGRRPMWRIKRIEVFSSMHSSLACRKFEIFFFHPLQNENYITVTVRSQHCASTKWTRITSTSSSAHMRRILVMFPGSRICVTKI